MKDLAQFNNLPNELFHEIFFHLDSTSIWKSLRLVSRRFKNAVDDEHFWRKRFSDFTGDFCYSKMELNGRVRILIKAEKEVTSWKNQNGGIRFLDESEDVKTIQSFSFIDCCELTGDNCRELLIAGCRDKSIKIWVLESYPKPLFQYFDAHDCWITLIKVLSNSVFLSFGFDGSIKKWKIYKNQLELISSIKFQSPVRSAFLTNSCISTISTDNKVRILDGNLKLTWTVTYFKTATTAISATDQILFLSSKSGWICSLHQKDWKRLNSIKLNSTVLSMELFNDRLYCGLENGNLLQLATNLTPIRESQVFYVKIRISHLKVSFGIICCVSYGGYVVCFQNNGLNYLEEVVFRQ